MLYYAQYKNMGPVLNGYRALDIISTRVIPT
jgi:hypothetical protein